MSEPKANEIFSYKTPGEVNRFAEPTSCLRKLHQFCKGKWSKIIDSAGMIDSLISQMEQKAEKEEDVGELQLALASAISAYEVLASAYRYAFGLPAFDPETGLGCTDDFCIELHNRFSDYLDGLKKSTETTPN